MQSSCQEFGKRINVAAQDPFILNHVPMCCCVASVNVAPLFRTKVDSFLLEDHLVVSENDAYEGEEEDDEEDNSRLDLDTSEEDDIDDDDEATSSSEDPVKGGKSSTKQPPHKFLLPQEGKDFEEEDDLEDILDEDDESDEEEGSDIDFASVAAVAAAGKVQWMTRYVMCSESRPVATWREISRIYFIDISLDFCLFVSGKGGR